MKQRIIFVTLGLLLCIPFVNANGFLKAPISRSSMFRFYGAAPFADQLVPNRDDSNLNCGGNYLRGNNDIQTKCGPCGDPPAGPFDNEAGGTYASGYPSAVYHEGDIVNVTVTITAKKRGGFFMMYLCPEDRTGSALEQCFQNNRLTFVASGTTQLHVSDFEGDGSFEVKLPNGVQCTNCVMRWAYVTADEYRCDPTGLCGLGYWDQPAYVNCADTMILPQGQPFPDDFVYPDYQALYQSIDGANATTTPGLTQQPILGSSTTAPSTGSSTGIPVVTVSIDPTATTVAPPANVTRPSKLVGPVIPASGLLPSLGFFTPFIPAAGLAGLAGLGLGWFGKSRMLNGLQIPPPPGPIFYRPVEMFGSPAYIPDDVPQYRGYGKSSGYGSNYNSYGNRGYGNRDYGNTNYGYSNYNNPYSQSYDVRYY